jgi:protoporphyrinogen oxidase
MKAKNIILGGGFAGLQLASLLNDSIIIEASPSVGGLLKSFKSDSGQFTFDIGGHVYTTKDELLSDIMHDSNPNYFAERKAYYDYQRQIPYPIQYHADELGIKLMHTPSERPPSLASLLIHEFGQEFYEKVLGPFNRRVWSTSPSQMDTDWIDGRIAKISEFGNNWGTNSSFYYACGEDILETMKARLRLTGTRIFTDSSVIDIKPNDKELYVDCVFPAVYKGTITYEHLFDTTGMLLNMNDQILPHNDVLTIGIGLNRKLDVDFHWWYNSVENTSPIHRITLLSRYSEKLAPDGVDSLLIEIPYKNYNNRDIYESENDNEYFSRIGVLSLLRRANFNFIDDSSIEEIVKIRSKGYPIPVITHRTKVAIARKNYAENCAYLVGRWGAHGYYNLDHIIHDAISAVSASHNEKVEDYYWANHYYKEKRRF